MASNPMAPIKYVAPQQLSIQPQAQHVGMSVVPRGDALPVNQTPGVDYVVSPEALAALSPEARQQIMEHGSPQTGHVQ